LKDKLSDIMLFLNIISSGMKSMIET